MKKLIGVGIGPGDKELITLKAIKAIKNSDVIFLPSSKGKSLAEQITEEYILDKEKVYLEFPMGEENSENYKMAAKIIDDKLSDGNIGVFLTLGDALTYSTFIYLYEELKKYEVAVEIIPGVTSFSAAFSKLKIPFSIKGEAVLVTDRDVDEKILKKVDGAVFLKANKNKSALEKLKANGFKYYYVKRLFLDGEAFYTDDKSILEDKDYLSLLLAKKE
ncbi:precorrin-2 C(20)-methyltransferase [Caloramator mitchellensis]|uniref:precorrin-2 C(20)-methyltransferase n=1 Tax=Caloramator mitchellensis TaxID=908809 RepID=UPI0007170476|nr:precorrin-2 C(20)-methyltransferase [Caloramator mitchellensis]